MVFPTPNSMKLAIFGNIDGNISIERYARELAANTPQNVDAQIVGIRKSPGIQGAVYDRYVRYFQIARKIKADCNLIVSEAYAFLMFALGAERTIVVCHDLHALIYRGWTGTYRFRYKMNLRMLPRARAIVTVSEHTKNDLLKYCPFIPPEKVFAIHNGLERKWRPVTDQVRLDELRRTYDLDGKKIILHVGNDNWYKNFATLLRAFATLDDPSLVLVKVGECGTANQVLIQDLGISDRFLQIRWADDARLMCIYSIAQMLVFPSLHEGFGWPPLEAMACGCPVIATRKASLPEVCGEACLYVEPRDVNGIAAAVRTLMKKADLRADLIGRGLLQAQKFDWRQTSRAILQTIQSI
jgi:glycosyltransferase involved in cell wall biosynthesis